MTSPVVAPSFALDPVPPERFSMSYLRSAEQCLRRAHFERIEDTAGLDAIIGRVFHEIADKVGFATVMRGETTPDYAEVERIARHVLANPEEYDPLPKVARDTVLELVGKWMLTVEFHPEEQFELSLRHKVRGRIISMRIDRLLIVGTTAYVKDYKTGQADPPQKPEPTPQGDVYSWGVVHEFPFITEVIFAQEHVRFGHPPQPFTYTLDAIAEIDEWLHETVSRIEGEYAAGGELPTNPGDACAAFGGCPVAADCHVKMWARPATELRSQEDALAEFTKLMAEEQSVKARKAAIQGWVEREAILALVSGEDDAVEQFGALLVEEASVAARKKKIRGYVARSGVRALQLNGQEIGYGAETSGSTDWKGLAMSTEAAANPETVKAFTKPSNPSFGRRKAK